MLKSATFPEFGLDFEPTTSRKRGPFFEKKTSAFLAHLSCACAGVLELDRVGYKNLAALGFTRRDVDRCVDALLADGRIRADHNLNGLLTAVVLKGK